MSRLKVGDVIRTSYNTGPYIIKSISEGCTCPSYLDSLNLRDDAPASAPHVHMAVTMEGDRGKYVLNGYDKNTLRSVWSNEYLINLYEIDVPTLMIMMQ